MHIEEVIALHERYVKATEIPLSDRAYLDIYPKTETISVTGDGGPSATLTYRDAYSLYKELRHLFEKGKN